MVPSIYPLANFWTNSLLWYHCAAYIAAVMCIIDVIYPWLYKWDQKSRLVGFVWMPSLCTADGSQIVYFKLSAHTSDSRIIMCQKCKGICGLWVPNEIIKEIYAENRPSWKYEKNCRSRLGVTF